MQRAFLAPSAPSKRLKLVGSSKCRTSNVTPAVPRSQLSQPASDAVQQLQPPQRQLGPPAAAALRGISLACASLVVLDAGIPLAAVAAAPADQQQHQSLLDRFKKIVVGDDGGRGDHHVSSH